MALVGSDLCVFGFCVSSTAHQLCNACLEAIQQICNSNPITIGNLRKSSAFLELCRIECYSHEEMQKFTAKIVDMMKQEKLYASQGGPIILSQGNDDLALVKSRWAFVNKDENPADKVAEYKLSRNRWWLERTTVEDMDIDVRAYLGGWKFIYQNDVKLLKCINHLSTDPNCLENLQRADAIKHLIPNLELQEGLFISQIHLETLEWICSWALFSSLFGSGLLGRNPVNMHYHRLLSSDGESEAMMYLEMHVKTQGTGYGIKLQVKLNNESLRKQQSNYISGALPRNQDELVLPRDCSLNTIPAPLKNPNFVREFEKSKA
ncbi:hypothetical protein Syun_009165 [Stephania yunnanensis]|uniref:Uncharacterized protein n=1 Tax=Stephania yunnanensis TaxID=152371 RepID=A0AAP0KDY3_9MAGN